MRNLLVLAWLVSIGWVVVIAASPRWITTTPGGPAHAAAAATYLVGSRICHQRPERSFRVAAVPLPVCVRCTGLYLGIPLGLGVALWRSRRRDPRSPVSDRASRAILLWAALPTIATVGLEWAAGIATPPLARFALAAVLAGLASWVCAERLAAEAGSGR